VKSWFCIVVAALSLSLFAAPALAKTGGYNDIVTFGNDVNVPAGEDVGSVIDFGGDATIHGHAHGDAVVFGGDLHIAPEGEVDGDTVSIGGSVINESRVRPHRAPRGLPKLSPQPMETPMPMETPGPIAPSAPESETSWPGGWAVFVLVDALLAFFAFVLFPVRTDHSLEQLHQQPLLTVLLGVISPIVLTVVVVIFAISVLGIPLIPVVFIAYLLAYYVGKAAVALFIGQRFLALARSSEARPIIAVLIGLIVLLVITGPWPLWFSIPAMSLIGCIAIGAALVSFMRLRPTLGAPIPVAPAPVPYPPVSGPPAVQ